MNNSTNLQVRQHATSFGAVQARQLLTWVFYAMRDGQVRSLATAMRQAA
jgi:hypothetical protein